MSIKTALLEIKGVHMLSKRLELFLLVVAMVCSIALVIVGILLIHSNPTPILLRLLAWMLASIMNIFGIICFCVIVETLLYRFFQQIRTNRIEKVADIEDNETDNDSKQLEKVITLAKEQILKK